MDDLMTRLADALNAQPWPPLGVEGQEIRRRGRRRRLQHRIAYGAGAGAAAAVVVAAPVMMTSWDGTASPTPAASDILHASEPDGVTMVFGVSMSLPMGWGANDAAGPDGQLRACLGPTPIDIDSCPVTVAVAEDPEQALTDGIDPASLVANACQPGDPNIVTVTSEVVDGRQAHQWTGQCTPDSTLRQAWALDNRTFAVIPGESAWDDEAQQLFMSARTPADWPHHDMEFTEATRSSP